MSERPACHTRYAQIAPFETRDGSEIRELMHPAHHAVRSQSLAEAIVEPGAATRLHLHRRTEEIYHVTAGRGRMRLGERVFDLERGDTVVIAPGTPHNVRNTGHLPLKILCACTPAYMHEDTELLDL
ncbi:MAG TPA: cupin domain-containing protein [Rhodocyclaceae bacterium]|nr:cupin domain-containing protein [Rhodocyclaceae bacterium]HNH99737.1 cupin domain-containing protein [Rhodocyclaceae bacterium]